MATPLQQATPVGTTGTTSPAISWPGATTVGNLLIAVVGISLVGNPSATLTPPSGWTLAGDIPSAANCQTFVYYIEGAASRSGAETFTLSLVNDTTLFLYEYPGMAASGAFDQEGETTGTSLTASSGTTPTTTATDQLVIAAIANRNISTQSSPTNSFTQLDQVQSTNATVTSRVNTGVYALTTAATGTYGTAVTLSGATARPFTGVVVTFDIGTSTEVGNTFEGGTDGVQVTAANSGGASGDAFGFASPAVSGVFVQYSADRPYRGGMCCHLNNGTSPGDTVLSYSAVIGTRTAGQMFGRAYYRVPVFPANSQGVRLAVIGCTTNAFSGEWRINTSGQLEQHNGSGVLQNTSSASVAADTWFRFEWAVLTISATVGQLECQLFLDPDAVTPTETLTSGATLNTRTDLDKYWVGLSSDPAWAAPVGFDVFVDDVRWSIYGYPGPSVPPPPVYGQTVGVG